MNNSEVSYQCTNRYSFETSVNDHSQYLKLNCYSNAPILKGDAFLLNNKQHAKKFKSKEAQFLYLFLKKETPQIFVILVAQNLKKKNLYAVSTFQMVYSDLQPKVPLGVVRFHLLSKYLLIRIWILHKNTLVLREVTVTSTYLLPFNQRSWKNNQLSSHSSPFNKNTQRNW